MSGSRHPVDAAAVSLSAKTDRTRLEHGCLPVPVFARGEEGQGQYYSCPFLYSSGGGACGV